VAIRLSVPRRLRGSHPRGADGRFISRSAAKGQITRIQHARQREAHRVERAHERKIRRRERHAAEEFPEELAPPSRQTIDDLEDWIEYWDAYEGDYNVIDIEAGVEYEG